MIRLSRSASPRARPSVLTCIASALLAATLVLGDSRVSADDGNQDSRARAAARVAQQEHGGRVLKVERKGDQYRVKLLKESGKVKVVNVSLAELEGEKEDGQKQRSRKQAGAEKRRKHAPDEARSWRAPRRD